MPNLRNAGMFKEPEYKLLGEPPAAVVAAAASEAGEGGSPGASLKRTAFDPSGGGDREKGLSLKTPASRTGKVSEVCRDGTVFSATGIPSSCC